MFDVSLFLLPIALVLFVIGGAIVAIIAFTRTGDLQRDFRSLERRLDLLARSVEAAAGPAAAAPEETETLKVPDATEPETASSPFEEVDAPRAAAESGPVPESETAPVPPTAPAAPAAATSFSWEEAFTSRWLVWLGAVTLALGGLFLVKYTIDQGLLGPTVRIILGVVMGLVLIAGGEWLRRRPLERALAAISPSYVPPALTSAGIATLYASIYAGYALYDMLAPIVAFVIMALISAAAVLLAFLHGPFMALLGIVGGFAIPALVSTNKPMAEALFPYLLLLVAGALAVVRYMGWWWLAWVTLLGAAIWPLIWFVTAWGSSDVYILGGYLLILGALFVLVRYFSGAPPATHPGAFHLQHFPEPERIAWVALTAVAILLFMLVRMDRYGVPSLVLAGAGAALMLLAARREAVFDAIPIMAGAMTASIVALWHLPQIVTTRAPMYILGDRAIGKVAGPVIPPELNTFVITTTAFAAIFAIGGFSALWGARRPVYWAAISAALPLVLFALAFWRIKRFEIDLAWTAAAITLAIVLLVAAQRVSRYRQGSGMTGALAAYAIGVIAALALAATTALENAWLTVALAAQLPAIAWIEGALRLPPLRRCALVLAAIVLARLVFNPEVLDYSLGTLPGFNWLLYGYGLPAIAFYWAARMLRERREDMTVTVLEAGTLVFTVLLISLEIRHLITGQSLDNWGYALEEQALNSIAWLAIAYALYRRHDITGRAVPVWGWRILAGMSAAQVAFLQLLFSNPIVTNDPIGAWPIFNIMLLAYGAPTLFAILFLRHAHRIEHLWIMRIAGVFALLLSFVWLTLEIRHAFQGSKLAYGTTSDAEWYAYSVAWLVYAAILLAVAIWRRYVALRYASLLIVMLTVAKVFLFDMSELTGIYRALSFIGLGLVLVSVGYFYRRFVFPPKPLSSTPPEAGQDDGAAEVAS